MSEYYPGIICPYCNEPIKEDEARVFDGEDWVHLGCDVEFTDEIWGYNKE